MSKPAKPAAAPKPVVFDPLSGATKVSVSLHGRAYYVTCDPGEEKRLADLVAFVEKRLENVASRNPGVTETRLFMIACLLLADDLMEAKRAAADAKSLAAEGSREEEDLMVAAVDHLRARVAHIAQQIGRA
jgi:cell division protein ZapA